MPPNETNPQMPLPVWTALNIVLWSAVGSVTGWIAGVLLWLNRVPDDYLPTIVGFPSSSYFLPFSLPVVVPLFRHYKNPIARRVLIKWGCIGFILGVLFMPSTSATFRSRIGLLFTDTRFAFPPTTPAIIIFLFVSIGCFLPQKPFSETHSDDNACNRIE